MNVKFTSTTSDKLASLQIVNGQLIYLSDAQEVYQDLNNARKKFTDVHFVNSIDGLTGRTGKIYVVVAQDGKADAYVWDTTSSSFVQLSSPIATASTPGLVKPDGTTITVDANGTISVLSSGSTVAAEISYDNTTSGLAATNVQTAVDEVVAMSSTLATDLTSRLELLESLMPWKGTRAQWNALSSAEKSKYKIINIIDE